ncbi:MAG: hypothetical protein ABIL68_15825 [bacterium]
MPVLTVERPLREKLGDEAIDALINLLNKALAEQKNDVLKFVEEKFERRLSEEISGIEVRLTEKIGRVETELSAKISQNYIDLSEKISAEGKKSAEYKADIIKWMFIFWVGQVGIILGILFAFFK